MCRRAISGIMLPVLIVGFFGLLLTPKVALSSEVPSKEKAPDFTLVDIYGETYCLYNCSAKVVLVEFFATWCPPCVQQTQALKNLYGNHSRDELEIVSIGYESEEILLSFAEENNMEWIVARDTVNLFDQYGVWAIPTSFIIDVEHYIQYEHVGLTDESTLRSEIESLLSPLIGDLNDDGEVDMQDIYIVILAFGSYPSHPRWNPIADVDKDDRVDMKDIYLVITNFGKEY